MEAELIPLVITALAIRSPGFGNGTVFKIDHFFPCKRVWLQNSSVMSCKLHLKFLGLLVVNNHPYCFFPQAQPVMFFFCLFLFLFLFFSSIYLGKWFNVNVKILQDGFDFFIFVLDRYLWWLSKQVSEMFIPVHGMDAFLPAIVDKFSAQACFQLHFPRGSFNLLYSKHLFFYLVVNSFQFCFCSLVLKLEFSPNVSF